MAGDPIKVNERPDQFRRKAQLNFAELEAKVSLFSAAIALLEGRPAYGGVYRVQQVTTAPLVLTTAYSVWGGFTENRPDPSVKMSSDFTTGTITVDENGVYNVLITLAYNSSTKNRYIDIGISVNGAVPVTPGIRQEIITTNGDVLTSYSSTLNITDAPNDYQLVVRGEIAMTLDFDLGGWVMERVAYLPPAAVGGLIL